MNCKNIFYFMDSKNKKYYKIFSVAILLIVLLLNICLQMIIINTTNLNKQVLNNNNLMLIQMFGQNKENSSHFMDTSKAQNIEHLVFIEESFDIIVNLYENGDFADEDLLINKMNKNYGEYVGIEDMQDGIIYSPKNGVVLSDKLSMESKFEELNLEYQTYDNYAPSVLSGECFVSEKTFQRIFDCLSVEEQQGYIPQYLIGVDKTENVYSVVQSLVDVYSDYDIHTFYQANGLQNLVTNSKNTILFQSIVFVVITIVSCIILATLISIMVNSMTKDLMTMYINGLNIDRMVTQFYKLILSKLRKPIILSFSLSVVSYLFLAFFLFKLSFDLLSFIIVLLANVVVIIICALLLNIIIKSKIQKKITNDNISSILRN